MLIKLSDLIAKYGFKPTGVLHLGSNDCSEYHEYKACGIEKMVFVDALPEMIEKGKAMIGSDPSVSYHVACLGEKDGEEVTFNIASNNAQSSSYLQFGSHISLHPTVEFVDHRPMVTSRLDSLPIDFTGLDLLNVDCQGVDLRIIKGLGDKLSQFKAVYMEVNKEMVYIGNDLFDDVISYLSGFGFCYKEGAFMKWPDGREAWGDILLLKEDQ